MNDEQAVKIETTEIPDKIEPGELVADAEPRRLTMKEQAHLPSDTVGTGSYAAISCSIMAILLTAVLIGGLLLFRWIF